ncbi:4,5-DOPA dioxygenase extradiol [Mucilaginibacter sp. P25]|uniref:4,5-DOPA dioxygenase extradiol n=1 Tax=Mucilaginibacter gossypii TaxID=551996 RepID=A0A1G8EYE2_9SPHI|nr:4,5-DOPA dioxygenase extradiol [Mucilaginibacter gossypii]SDH74895.1 4,5-DOPA dioxygenase extradiol [Mucilaginibacter gossypii]
MKLQELANIAGTFPLREKTMPMLFIGHGHPMNALWDNDFTQTLTKLGRTIDKPSAVLVISAHWETIGTYVSVNPMPRTIHDFGGFAKELFEVRYEPKGHPELARELKSMVSITDVIEDHEMGLDHGAWTVLKFIWPDADVPVFEMSMDYSKPAAFHYQLGEQLKELRRKGVLILCSGNIVHNLRMIDWREINAKPYDWNVEFDQFVKNQLENRNFEALINYEKAGTAARLSVPTNDHYLPLMYALGLIGKKDEIKPIYEGYQFGSLSMRCFQAG